MAAEALLLDTHAVLWALGDPDRLGTEARARIERAQTVAASVASFWEIAIKAGLGKLEGEVDALIPEAERAGFALLPIRPAHLSALRRLAPLHRDPFDRMLVAQAQAEGLTLATADRRLAAYDVPRLDLRARAG